MNLTVSTYSLIELVLQHYVLSFITLFLLYFALAFVWRLLFFPVDFGVSAPKGFLGAWYLSARFFIFWTIFFYVAVFVFDKYIFAPDTEGLLVLKHVNQKLYAEEISHCTENISFRKENEKIAPVWFDSVRLSICLANIEGKVRLGKNWEPEPKTIERYLNDFLNTK